MQPMRHLRMLRLLGRKQKVQFSLLTLFIILLSTASLIRLYSSSSSTPSSLPSHRSPCPEISPLNRRELFHMLGTTSRLLERLRVTHFLCYMSLWGAAQESGPFPWDPNAQLCALNSPEGLGGDEPALLRAFRRAGLNLDYSSADANYRVTNTSLPQGAPYIQVTLFEEDPRLGAGTYRRVGWKRRLLPPNCDGHSSLECFPSSLVQTPLPRRTFGPLSLPTPRENIDLLKFHYPDTWYKPVLAQC